jgi:transcriptional regulator with XRE-family HTH domain
MPHRERQRDRGARRAQAGLADLGRELREARRASGLRQIDVGHAASISPSWVSRIERGLAPDVSLRLLFILLAVVGLDLSVRAYAGGQPLRDEAHRRLLERIRHVLPKHVAWRTEVPLPIPGDPRAWDALAGLWGLRAAIEAELRPTDLQALERRLALKLRDGAADRLILVLADTKSNRHLLRLAGESLRATFPLQGNAALKAIQSAQDPGCNLLLLL